MRLWHKDLIGVLPCKQLIAQWRELCCIAKNIAKDCTPNHLLVNKVLEYPVQHFILYSDLVLRELHKRGYKVSERAYMAFIANLREGTDYFSQDKEKAVITDFTQLYAGWHNMRYLDQCYYNLQEKYDCGGITYVEYCAIVFEYKMLQIEKSEKNKKKVVDNCPPRAYNIDITTKQYIKYLGGQKYEEIRIKSF